MVFPNPGTTIMNQGGMTANSTPDSSGALRGNQQSPYTSADAANDRQNENEARNHFNNGDEAKARESVGKIKDPTLRMKILRILWNERADQSPPTSLLRDGSGGLSDPLALFFMMIYYLSSQSKQIDWSSVLYQASKNSNQNFSNLQVSESFLPQAKSTDPTSLPEQLASSTKNYKSQQTSSTKELEQQQRDSQKRLSPTKTADDFGEENVQIWPIQNMPIIEGGISKSVGWDATKVNATTFAEPIISVNSGAEHIECDVEFTYAVGIAGLKESQSGTKDGGFDQKNEDVWTVEQVMGIMYLATSLVYPFESAPIVGSKTQSASDIKNQSDGKEKSPQFPVVFMRHYSLFPFLTPFVVKSVKIIPDENQPLIITEPLNLKGSTLSHLTFPAVRQVVKITISLISAHYYVTMFTESNSNDLQKQTSGKTYHSLGKKLLGKKGL